MNRWSIFIVIRDQWGNFAFYSCIVKANSGEEAHERALSLAKGYALRDGEDGKLSCPRNIRDDYWTSAKQDHSYEVWACHGPFRS